MPCNEGPDRGHRIEKTIRRFLLCLSLAFAGCGATTRVHADGCAVEKTGETPMARVRGQYQVTALVNGETPVTFLVDTGAETSVVDIDLAERLGLPARPGRRTFLIGTDGLRGKSYPKVTIERLVFAGVEFQDVAMAQAERKAEELRRPQGTIGADLLSRFDVEFDFPNERLALYRVSPCGSGHIGFRPWLAPHDAVPVKIAARNIVSLPVIVDGTELELALDTGATRTKIPLKTAARKLSMDLERLKQDAPETISRSTHGTQMRNYAQRFESVRIGAATYRNIVIKVSEIQVDPYDGLLGLDFLHSRKVWISYATRQLLVARTR